MTHERAIYLKQLELGPMQNFIYLIGDPETKEAAVVDPGWQIPKILKAAEQDGYRLTKVFVTHFHFDHSQGLDELLKAVDMPVYAHKHDVPMIEGGQGAMQPVAGGETVLVGSIPVTLIHTPGHTKGSQCLLVNGKLLTGDTLFIGACGRTDLPGGDPAKLYESFDQRLRKLDDQTIVCPGHNYAPTPTSSIGEEKRSNPYFGARTLDEFLRLTGFA